MTSLRALSPVPAVTDKKKSPLLVDIVMASSGSVQFGGLIVVLQESTMLGKSDAILGINLNLF